MGGDEQPTERLQLLLKTNELEAIDDFRFANRLPSRSAAIREILRRGLLSLDHMPPSEGAQSRDFGVLHQKGRKSDVAVGKGGTAGNPNAGARAPTADRLPSGRAQGKNART